MSHLSVNCRQPNTQLRHPLLHHASHRFGYVDQRQYECKLPESLKQLTPARRLSDSCHLGSSPSSTSEINIWFRFSSLISNQLTPANPAAPQPRRRAAAGRDCGARGRPPARRGRERGRHRRAPHPPPPHLQRDQGRVAGANRQGTFLAAQLRDVAADTQYAVMTHTTVTAVHRELGLSLTE